MLKNNWYLKLKIKNDHNKAKIITWNSICVYISIFFEWCEHIKLPLWQSSALVAEPYTQFLSCWLSIICAFEGASVFKVQTISDLSLSLTYGHGNELGRTWVSLSQLSTYDFLWFSFLLWKGFMPFFNVSFFLFAIAKGQGIDDGSLGKGNGPPQLLLYCC